MLQTVYVAFFCKGSQNRKNSRLWKQPWSYVQIKNSGDEKMQFINNLMYDFYRDILMYTRLILFHN